MIFKKGRKRGEWEPLQSGDQRKASIVCPECGRMRLIISHTINADGTVSPSVVCGMSDCSFHEFIKLEEWN